MVFTALSVAGSAVAQVSPSVLSSPAADTQLGSLGKSKTMSPSLSKPSLQVGGVVGSVSSSSPRDVQPGSLG